MGIPRSLVRYIARQRRDESVSVQVSQSAVLCDGAYPLILQRWYFANIFANELFSTVQH